MRKIFFLYALFFSFVLNAFSQNEPSSAFGLELKLDAGYSLYRHRTFEVIPQIGIRYKSHSLFAGPVYCNDVSWSINLDYYNDKSARHSGYSISYLYQVNPRLSVFAGYAWNDVFACHDLTIVDPDPSQTRSYKSIITSKEVFAGMDYCIFEKKHFAAGCFLKCVFLNEDFYFKNITLNMESSSKSTLFCPVVGIYSKFKS